MSLKALMDYTFTAKYSRYLSDKKRRETWKESVDRVRAMMLEKYADKNIEERINWAYDMMYKKRVLGSQRALQFGGEPIFKHHARIYNCLDRNTKFITSHGVRSFNDFSDGDSIDVLTHTGKWQQAIVKQYGEAYLNKITLQKGNAEYIVYATDNHRWILHDGEVTESLKINDRIYKPEDTFNEFTFESSSIEEQLYWCYGYVYGDGTINNGYSMVRLCGNDASYEHRFTNLGFKSSSSLSLNGDVMIYTGKYQKTAPDPKIDNPLLIRAFVAGYLAADGTKSRNANGSKYINIQSSDVDHINFIRECFPLAGVWIISEKDLTEEKTNFGIRPYTVSFRISTSSGSKFNTGWRVKNIEKQYKKDTVWCLEVENDKSFILPCGIVTGNCVSSYIDRLRFFQECMYLLLCGCGAGFSVQKHHIANLPSLLSIAPDGNKRFVIEDNIEGWSDAVGVLVSSYFEQSELFPEYTGKVPIFDYSRIREKNAPLSNGGKAPGPEPLRKALKNIKKILDNAIARVEFNSSACRKLKPIEAYDIVMHFADAVISGGVRRSATICVFSPDDEEMAKAKTGNWFIENPQRGRSNNSALLLRDKTTPEQFAELMKSVKEFGEPGFVWSDSTELIVNPCVEIGMYPVDVQTELSGWQGCNLSTINCSKVNTPEDFYDACEAAAIIGTLQAGFTSFPYLGEVSERIFRRESLLGVSGTGWLEKPEICLNPEVQQRGAEIVKETNAAIANIIGIPVAARTTCVKPEGSSSCVLGTASGIHPHHAKRYIRRVQANKSENVYKHFKNVNPRACEESVWSANKTDDVISFCVEVPDGSKTKNQVCASSLLEIVKSTQQNWVIPGTNLNLCTKPWLNHNVSNTINVQQDEWQEVEEFIYNNRKYFCGISLLPATGDKDYPQAPFTTVYLPSEMLSHYGEGAMFASGLIEASLTLWNNNLWAACSDLINVCKDIQYSLNISEKQKNWIDRCYKYAGKYFDGDIKKLTYCMKDVYNYKLWTELQREYKPVDYTTLIESEDNTELEQALACSNGSCEII